MKDRGRTLDIALFSWPPWLAMSDQARVLWLALYASAAALRCPVGLWHGGPGAMSDAGGQDSGVVSLALGELRELGAVEYDQQTRVARLVELPGRAERPANGDVVRSWWTRFRAIPQCAVRDRHVPTLRWLIDTFTDHHQRAWDATFGEIERTDRGHGGGHGGPHRGGHRVGSSASDPLGHRVGHLQGEGEGEDLRSGSQPQTPPRSSLQTTSRARASDPTPPAGRPPSPHDPVDAGVLREVLREHGDGIVVGLVDAGLQRYGPRGVAAAGSGSHK